MDVFEKISCAQLNEETYKTTLENGLEVYICKKAGYQKKIGMFGTKYGSLHNDFIDITTGKRTHVPDGVAHYLEHKLFEQEGANALDLFAKEGISSNAYTSFDHTVYFFETIDKFEKGLGMLIKLVKTPYFTDENVEKERGIIGQEISMYDDDPSFRVYFEALRNMYHVNPVNIDIAGTIESISNITKEVLYTCYNTFYNLSNMFIVIIGDVDLEDTLRLIKDNLSLYDSQTIRGDIVKFEEKEPKNIVKPYHELDMKLSMPQINIGFKLDVKKKNEMVKTDILCQIISEMYFSRTSDFYEKMYNEGLITDDMALFFEGTKEFSHVLIMAESNLFSKAINKICDYATNLKNEIIDSELLETAKKKLLGEFIIKSEDPNNCYRRIIDSILNGNDLYYNIEILKEATTEDIKGVLNYFSKENMIVSVVK